MADCLALFEVALKPSNIEYAISTATSADSHEFYPASGITIIITNRYILPGSLDQVGKTKSLFDGSSFAGYHPGRMMRFSPL